MENKFTEQELETIISYNEIIKEKGFPRINQIIETYSLKSKLKLVKKIIEITGMNLLDSKQLVDEHIKYINSTEYKLKQFIKDYENKSDNFEPEDILNAMKNCL